MTNEPVHTDSLKRRRATFSKSNFKQQNVNEYLY